MRILVVAAGNRQPTWIDDGFSDYARRVRGSCTLELVEISLGRRPKSGSSDKAQKEESARMLRVVPKAAHVVALTVEGRPRSPEQLADRLQHWMTLGTSVALLVGGPDG